ncbi:MAG: hypothetical protein WKF59_17660 [Chitinophagaceae bacterium]
MAEKENWTIQEVTKVTFTCALAHGFSTIIIGVLLAYLGAKLDSSLTDFTNIIAPIILIAIGMIFIYRHHKHKHFHVDGEIQKKKTKSRIITALVIAMFFSPCMEIEAYFLLAGTQAKWLVWFIALLYLLITTTGMVLLVRFALQRFIKIELAFVRAQRRYHNRANLSSYRYHYIFYTLKLWNTITKKYKLKTYSQINLKTK